MEEIKEQKEKEKNCSKKRLKSDLYTILANISFFLKRYESYKYDKEELNNVIFTHPISNNKNINKIKTFSEIILNTKEVIGNKLIELREESEIRKRRKTEIEDLKNFLNTNIKLLENQDNNKLLLPSDESKSDDKKVKEKNEDDIIVEDTKEVEKQNLLKKENKKNILIKHVIYVKKD